MRESTGQTVIIHTSHREEAWAIASTLVNEKIDYEVEASEEDWTFRFVEEHVSRKARDFLTGLDNLEGHDLSGA